MRGVLVVYESLYGTNLKIAQAIADGFGTDADITILPAEAAPAVVEDDVAGKPQKYFSADGVGTLLSGEEERARSWGAELADLLRRGSSTNRREPW